jgi:hypothetical protein
MNSLLMFRPVGLTLRATPPLRGSPPNLGGDYAKPDFNATRNCSHAYGT